MAEKTWELVVQPDAPIGIDKLQVELKEGGGLRFPLRRSDLANMVNANWNAFIAEMAGKRKADVKSALDADDMKRYLGCFKQVAGISSMYRFCGARLDGKKLGLEVGVTDFKDYIGTNAHAIDHPDFRKIFMEAGMEDAGNADYYFANPLPTCSNLVTSDNKVPLGMRGPTVAVYPNVPHVIGGYVRVNAGNSKSFSAADIDFSRYMLQELKEELGLEEKDVAGMEFLGIALHRPLRISEILYNTWLNVDARQLEEMWRTKARDKFENRKITFYSPEEVADVLYRNEGRLVPSCEAALTLFLGHYHPNFRRN